MTLRSGVLAAALALAACATSTGGAGSAPTAISASSGAVASGLPDFQLTTVAGDPVKLSDYLGKSVIVLSFWDTWCEPCKTELPHLDEMYRAHKDQGLVVLAVAMDDSTTLSQVGAYVHRAGLTFPVLLDPDTRAAGLYNKHKSAPYTVVINRAGRIASEKAGYEPGAEQVLEAEVNALLAAVPATP